MHSRIPSSDEAGLGALASGRLDESDVDVGEDTTGSDSAVLKESVELLVVSNSELDVSGDDSGLLGVLGGVASELENLSSKVLKDGSKIDGGTGTNSGGGSVLLEESGDSTDGELETGSGSLGHGSGGGVLSLSSSFSGHFVS